MLKEPIPTHNESNNVYAYNIKWDGIHISEAISGKKGYYCLGCKREMQAVKSSIIGRLSYFRHDATSVKGQPRCTYSDETYRHQIAKEILSRLKKIKVPAVYKYPPIESNNKAYLLSEATTIEAHSVGNERTFYEDENGQIHYQKEKALNPNKYLLIRPDVTFFDENGKPILFIEIVVTHKISDDKRTKLKRLGIDTIQVKIPKDSPQEIENSFFNTRFSKWVHNNEEQRTEYDISISSGDSEGILPVDEEQRKLFEESFNCRAAQINNLIRAIKRCLESKPYSDATSGIGSELSRLKRNTETHREQWRELQRSIQLEAEKRYRERRENLTRGQQLLYSEEGEFQRYYKDLERRYFAKRSLLETRIRETIASLGGNEQPFEARRGAIERERAGIDASIRNGRRRIEKIRGDSESFGSALVANFEAVEKSEREEIERIQNSFDELPIKIENSERGLRTEFKHLEETERREITNCESFETGYGAIVEEGRRELKRRYETIGEQIIKSVKTRDAGGYTEFSRKLKELIKNGALLQHIKETYAVNERNRKAWECFKEGTYKDWI